MRILRYALRKAVLSSAQADGPQGMPDALQHEQCMCHSVAVALHFPEGPSKCPALACPAGLANGPVVPSQKALAECSHWAAVLGCSAATGELPAVGLKLLNDLVHLLYCCGRTALQVLCHAPRCCSPALGLQPGTGRCP